jgi:competence protein ComEA
MNGPPPTGTRWFSLSGRELAVLALGVGLVLAAVAAVRAADWVWGAGDVVVLETSDMVAPEARLDVNVAPAYELALLPGIGPKTAEAVVADRTANGPFRSLDDLTRVKGIGPATVEEIRPHAMCVPPGASRKRK